MLKAASTVQCSDVAWRRRGSPMRQTVHHRTSAALARQTARSSLVVLGAQPAMGLSGPGLRGLFAAAATWLERNAAAVNAINVFPVPDGDTGTNMAATLRAAAEAAQRAGETTPDMLAALAHGALMGARGNSGVILSQY